MPLRFAFISIFSYADAGFARFDWRLLSLLFRYFQATAYSFATLIFRFRCLRRHWLVAAFR